MSQSESILILIDQLKAGDEEAARILWEECYPRLVNLARRRLEGIPRKIADEEDVALSALKSFCKGARLGRFPDLRDRDGLWRLLFRITANKATDVRRYENRRRVLVDWNSSGPRSTPDRVDQLAGAASEEAVAVLITEELEQKLGQLDPELSRLAVAKLEGYTNREIADRFQIALRTVERRLDLVRRKWVECEPKSI